MISFMTLKKDNPGVTSFTGIWERHVLAEIFGIPDPLSEQLDRLETATYQLCIFSTPHGLGVLVPKDPTLAEKQPEHRVRLVRPGAPDKRHKKTERGKDRKGGGEKRKAKQGKGS